MRENQPKDVLQKCGACMASVCMTVIALTCVTAAGASIKYGSYVGGSNDDWISSVSVGPTGCIYVAGKTVSWDFPTNRAYQGRSANFVAYVRPLETLTNFFDRAEIAEWTRQVERGNEGDGFIAKQDQSGSNLLFSTFLGGDRDDAVNDMCVDENGNVYIVGVTSSPDFPVKNPLQVHRLDQGEDHPTGFFAKLDATGNLVFSSYLGGSQVDVASCIAVDNNGNMYVGGSTASADFPVVNAIQMPQSYRERAFVTKIDTSGQSIVYSTYLGGADGESCRDITVDAQGCVYVAGSTTSTNYPIVNGYVGRYMGRGDAFLTKLNPNGDAIAWSTYFGGSAMDEGVGVQLDGLGHVFLVGTTESTNMPVTNALCGANSGETDAFIARFSANSGALGFSTYLGGSKEDALLGCSVDSAGNFYACGVTGSTDLPVTNGIQCTVPGGFWLKLNTNLTLSILSYLGASDGDRLASIASGPSNRVYVAGSSMSTNLPVTSSALQPVNRGVWDGIIMILEL